MHREIGRSSPRRAGEAGCVLHLVGRLPRGGVRGTLWPTVLALADAEVPQVLVTLDARDDERVALMLPAVARLAEPGPAGRGWGLRDPLAALRREAEGPHPVIALHLHGLGALLQARRLLRADDLAPLRDVPLFLHLDQERLAARLIGRTGRSVFVVRPDRIAALEPVPGAMDEPLDEASFATARRERAMPLIVTAGTGADLGRAQAFADLAVMLSGMRPAIEFGWVGEVPEDAAPLLAAAKVTTLRGDTAQARAEVYARAWVYAAPGPRTGAGRDLAEAMAAGLPCVASTDPVHRALIIHTLSGYLCGRHDDMLRCIARLVEGDEGASLRRAMGLAARARSRHRHGRHRFRGAMLLAHGLSPLPVLRRAATMPLPGDRAAPARR